MSDLAAAVNELGEPPALQQDSTSADAWASAATGTVGKTKHGWR